MQQQQGQSSGQQQRYQIVPNEMPVGIHLDAGNNLQNSQNTLLTTNHSLPISSSVISNSLNQQAAHSQSLSQISQQQPPIAHLQSASSSDTNLPKSHENSRPKRYSNQRQRSAGIETQQSQPPQTQPPQQQRFQLVSNDIPIGMNEIPIGMDYNVENLKYAAGNATAAIPSDQRNSFNRTTQINSPQLQKQQPTQANVPPSQAIEPTNFTRNQQTPNAFARNQQSGNSFIGIDYNVEGMKYPNEYPPAINPTQTQGQFGQPTAYLQTAGTGFLPQTGPPPAASVSVVPQIMNFVPAHPPLQAAPVVQSVGSGFRKLVVKIAIHRRK